MKYLIIQGGIVMVGSWSEYRNVTDEDIKIVEEAYEGLTGMHFEPISVSTQVVNGVNYHFIGTVGVVYPGAPKSVITVRIFKPTDGKAVLA